MKERILEVCEKLKIGELTENEAQDMLLDLFGVSLENQIRDCFRCEFDIKLGFCPRCDTQAYSN